MYSELKHSKKLSKRLQRDSEFHDILHGLKKHYDEIEPGLREVKYLKDMESLFSDISENHSIDLMEEQECTDPRERLRLNWIYQRYKSKKDLLLKKRLQNLK